MPPERDRRLLHDVAGIGPVRHEDEHVAQDRRLMAQEQAHEPLVQLVVGGRHRFPNQDPLGRTKLDKESAPGTNFSPRRASSRPCRGEGVPPWVRRRSSRRP